MSSDPECVFLSSSDEEVPCKQPRLSSATSVRLPQATSVQWTGKLRSVQKKPAQSSISKFFGKSDIKCDVSAGTSNRRLAVNRKNNETFLASSSSSSRGDSESPCQSSISTFISSCDAFLTPSTEKIRKKLHKLNRLSPKVKEEIGKFIDTVGHLRRENVFTKIKMVLDETKKYEASPGNGEENPEEAELLSPVNEVFERRLKKMDNIMTRIHLKIKELREREVDLDDEDNSSFLLEERLTKKLLQVHAKYCKLQGTRGTRFKYSKMKFEGSRYPGLDKIIQDFLIKQKEAPDFADIFKIVRNYNSHLKLDDSLLQNLAQDCFKRCVEIMKLARVGQHMDSLHGYVDDTPTSIPAQLVRDEELQRMLQENKQLAEANLEKVINAYATKQEELKLEPEEYDSSEESPDESEDEEGANVNDDKESEGGESEIFILEEEENELRTEEVKDKHFEETYKIPKNNEKLKLVDALDLAPTVINAYATKQEELKLEPEGCDSGEESPDDSEDEEGANVNDDTESEGGESEILILEEEENELRTGEVKDKHFEETYKIPKNNEKLKLVDALDLAPTVESCPTEVLTDLEECEDILYISDTEDDVTLIHQAEPESA